MTRPGTRKGFSLVEVSIYSSLLLLVLGMTYASLVLCLRYYRTLENQGSLQQSALTAVANLSEDLAGTAEASVRVEGDGLVFLSARGAGGQVFYDAEGRVLWTKFLCYYVDGQGNLLRREQALTTPTPEVPETTPTVASFSSRPSLPTRHVAGNVTGLSLTPGSTVGLAVTVSNNAFGGSMISVNDQVQLHQ